MEPKKDRRVQKTLLILNEALMSLIREKPYEQITVQEILDRANVGRSTFYSHFRDKDDLLLSGFDSLREELSQAQQSAPGSVPQERMIAFSLAMFVHAEGFRPTYNHLMRSQAGPLVRQRTQQMIGDLIRKEYERLARKGWKVPGGMPAELLVHYLAATFVTVLTWWLESRHTLQPVEINNLYRSLVLPVLTASR